MNVYKAKTLAEALAYAEAGAQIMAGCTNLYVELKKNGHPDADFVDISALSELKTVTKTDGETRIGALVTFADILRQLDETSALWQAAYSMGSPQIRSRATVAGNICDASPACDAGPALLVSDARIELRSVRGCRELPIGKFFTGYRKTAKSADELVTAIILPDGTERSVFRKVGLRNALSVSVVSLAAAKRADSLLLAMGSVAETPVRLVHCEQLIKDTDLSSEMLREALASDISPISDLRASREYRFETALALLADVLRKEYGYDL